MKVTQVNLRLQQVNGSNQRGIVWIFSVAISSELWCSCLFLSKCFWICRSRILPRYTEPLKQSKVVTASKMEPYHFIKMFLLLVYWVTKTILVPLMLFGHWHVYMNVCTLQLTEKQKNQMKRGRFASERQGKVIFVSSLRCLRLQITFTATILCLIETHK